VRSPDVQLRITPLAKWITFDSDQSWAVRPDKPISLPFR